MSNVMSAMSTASDGSYVLRYDRLQVGDYFADFRRDKRLSPEVYHCIIQREGSSEILSWSQYRSLEAARRAAEAEINRLSSNASK